MSSSSAGIVHKAVNAISGLLFHIAMWGVVVLMLLVIVDISMRSLFGRGTLIATEIGGYLLVLIAYLGMAEAYKQGRHIRVDILTFHLSRRVDSWLDVVLSFVGLLMLINVIWRSFIMVHHSRVYDVRIPGIFSTPVYLPQTLIIMGLLALALQCIVDLGGSVFDLKKLAKNLPKPIAKKSG